MQRLFGILAVCLLACTVGFAQDAPERSLPKIAGAPCSTPAYIMGEARVATLISDAEEAGQEVLGVDGGCGSWKLTEKQSQNLGELLLENIQGEHSDADCKLLSSSNVDEPFGLQATVYCSKTIELNADLSVMAHLLIAMLSDSDGEVIVIFLSASSDIL